MKSVRNKEFLVVVATLLATIFLVVATYFHWLPINFSIGPFRLAHWLDLAGVFFIAVAAPAFYVLRRRYPKKNIAATKAHCLGNLVSFMFISIHFTEQTFRAVHPEDRTGLTSFVIVTILVATGLLQRFQLLRKEKLYPPHANRFLHISTTTAFYVIVSIHALHTLGFL